MRPDVFVLVGHSAASTRPINRAEFAFHRRLIDQLGPLLSARGVAFELAWRGTGQAGSPGLRQVIDHANHGGFKLGIELHANSSPSPAYSGTEVLHWPGSARGAAAAAALLAPIARVMNHPGKHVHRVIPQGRSWSDGPPEFDARGVPVPNGDPLEWLKLTRFPALILESHYLTNPASVAWAEDRLRDGSLARAVVDGIVAALG